MLLQQRLFPALAIRPPSLLNADNIGLLTPKEVADLLQINQSWLAKARTLGTGPPHLRIGRSVRYREAALVQWTKSQQETSPGEQQSPTRKPNRRK